MGEIVKYNNFNIPIKKVSRLFWPQEIIFVAFLFIYLIIGYFPKISGFSYITGDEPHYLIMTQSVANDGDFNLDNNYELESHKEFYNAPIGKHYINIHGKNYSWHQFGLPIIMAPLYKLFGYKGVLWGMIWISCLGLVSVYNICKSFTDPKSAFASTFLLGLTVPVGIYLSSQFFPETIAFSLFAFLISIVLRPDFKYSKLYFISILTISIILSLMHVKFTLLTFGVGLLSLIMSLKNKSSMHAFIFWILIGIITVVVTYLGLYLMYDGYVLDALYKTTHPGGNESESSLSIKYILRGVYLNFFDKEKGILWFMPILFVFLNPIYIYRIIRYKLSNYKVKILGVFISTVPYLVVVFSFFDTLAGWCPPGRYLMPSMVFVAILLSLVIDITPKWLFKLSIFITVLCVLNPIIMYTSPNNHWAPTTFFNTISDLIISAKMTNYATTVDSLSKVRFVGLLIGSIFAVTSYELITKLFTITNTTTNNS